MDETIDLGALRDSIRDVLNAECPRELIVKHAQHNDGMDRELWSKAVELGWTMLTIPEDHGGLGLGIEALAVLHEELGRAAAPLPFLSSLLAAKAISDSADAAICEAWLPRLAAGAVASLSLPMPLGSTKLSVNCVGDSLVLTGAVLNLLDGADAEILVLLAKDEHGELVRVVLDVTADGIQPARTTLWDRGRSLANLGLDGLHIPAERAWPATGAQETALANHAAIALAADSVGGQAAVLDMTIDYLKTRQQFGRPIGSFQALKHRVADHRTRFEGDIWLLRSAVSAVAGDMDHRATEASAAKALATANYVGLGRDAIQLHGGIGFTAEYPIHVFVKRALLNEQLLGNQAAHLTRAVSRIVEGAA
ncbi:acyl-CoA dehydrogenase family protein [Novosphingobium cyanobacteriorum]|uniref:Acyl-CoA dehydrogenase family protein n=1 Tax=Novosphingobium cyanobacteriorum TaxID=3024215 RepID=A0ABT6CMD4_9SPHN|nr:acyl-CoA dehydrogenase family protein [Novosphingobium cyanobacteriorum]MDF8334966.1 acyl-CoA dehydrogenase family protein [Novosphingobium cyanobacteriorum]